MTRGHALLVATLLCAWPAAVRAQQPPDHSGHQHAPAQPAPPPAAPLPDFIPPVTDADREAAFPDVRGHSVHDRAVNYFVLFDQFEWQAGGDDDSAFSWDNRGWIGRDRDRFWFRTEGERDEERLAAGQAHFLYGRAVARWWDLVAGVRQDFRPGPAQTWAAIGVQGLAPYWFEVEATAYVGGSGRTQFRLEAEYELLVTNRLILQPLVELAIHGKSDPERGVGTGLSSTDVGLRLRYELRREFAPYVGVTWNRKYFGTADHAAAAGERTSDTRVTLGVRFWM